MKEKELLELKEQIDEAKVEVSKLQGRKQQLIEQLKNEYGVENLKQARQKLEKMDEEIQQYQDKIDEGIENLENQLSDE